jgi:hypothetical protein
MKAAIKEASALQCKIHSLKNFPKRKWQKLYRHDIEHSFGHWNLISDDVKVVPRGAHCTKVQWKPRLS